MNKANNVNTKKTSYLIKRFIPYFTKYKKVLILDLVCATLTTLCDIVLPVIIGYLTDTATTDASQLTFRLIFSIGGIYLVLRIIDLFASYYMSRVGHIMGAKIETDMRTDLFRHLQELSYSYYTNTKIGQLMARMTSDLFDITEFAHHCPEEFYIAAIKIGVAFCILCTVNIPLSIIIFAIIPIMLFFSMRINTRMRTAFKEQRNQLGEINASVEDSLLGVNVVKSFANEDMESKKFEKGNRKFLDTKRETYKALANFQSVTRLFDGIMYLTATVAGAIFMMKGLISAGDFAAYLMYVVVLIAAIRRVVEFTEQFQRGLTGIERFIEVMDVESEIRDVPGAAEMTDVKGHIAFENVTFRYAENEAPVLENFNLDIEAGESIAFVGPSGAGKTTLCNLIPRFYDPTSGRILIDGMDIKEVTSESLRNQIGMVQQDVYLFSGSVYDNIEYGRPGATKAEIVAAARLAGAHEFISQLPEGYKTFVGERGVRLSGGQKQRISIARVFLKNPPILILDEATSALDNESEHIVQESLERLTRGRTTLTIAHRLTTIKNAKTIIVLTEDGIAEKGSHEELMARGEMYAGLYKMYEDKERGE